MDIEISRLIGPIQMLIFKGKLCAMWEGLDGV